MQMELDYRKVIQLNSKYTWLVKFLGKYRFRILSRQRPGTWERRNLRRVCARMYVRMCLYRKHHHIQARRSLDSYMGGSIFRLDKI